MTARLRFPLGLLAVLAASIAARAGELAFDRIVIDDNFPGAYQVEVADVNGDGKPDVVAVGGNTCAWYENPTWKKRVITTGKQTPGIISSATHDLDGDGRAEAAIAYEFSMNEPTKGKLLLAKQGNTLDDPWTTTFVADVPSIHRLRWGQFHDYGHIQIGPNSVKFEKKIGLAVAPIFGKSAKPPVFDQGAAQLEIFFPSAKTGLERMPSIPHAEAPVMHAIDVVDLDGQGDADVLGASNLGVTWVNRVPAIIGAVIGQPQNLTPGAPGTAPKKGASEIHPGRLKDGRRFLSTVEPWHGTDVAVYFASAAKPITFGSRNVIDASMKDGHALWVADVDGDGDDEILAGYRGAGTSVLAFDFNGKGWDRTVVDRAIAAQDLRGGDLDGDGRPDVVAVGGATHNVVWYRPRR